MYFFFVPIGKKAADLEKKRCLQPKPKAKKKKKLDSPNQDSGGDAVREGSERPLTPAQNGTLDQDEEQGSVEMVNEKKTTPQEGNSCLMWIGRVFGWL